MTELARGIKAGVLLGIIYGISEVALLAIVVKIWGAEILGGVLESLLEEIMIFAAVIFPVVGIVGGIIVGAIYAEFYGSIPGSTSVRKGVVLGAVLWLLISGWLGFNVLLSGKGMLLMSLFSLIFGTWLGFGAFHAAAAVAVGIFASLLSLLFWGGLLGAFWDRLG